MERAGTSPIVRSQLVPLVLSELRERAMDADRFAKEFSVEASQNEAFLPLDRLHALLEAAELALEDRELGVRLALRRRTGTHGVLEYCWRTAPTVRAGFQAIARFGNLLNDVAVVSLEEDGEGAAFVEEVATHPDGFGRHANDFFAILVKQEFLTLAGAEIALDVRMPHARPVHDEALRAVLGAGTVRYGEPTLALRFDRAYLDRPLLTADATLHQTLLKSAEELVRARRGQRGDEGEPSLVAALRRLVEAGLPSGAVDLRTLARSLAMSPRTLQRRISETATTLSMIIDGVREERARALIVEGKLTVGEVSAALGYADTAAFVRAFRRWTGTTPKTFRRERGGRSVG